MRVDFGVPIVNLPFRDSRTRSFVESIKPTSSTGKVTHISPPQLGVTHRSLLCRSYRADFRELLCNADNTVGMSRLKALHAEHIVVRNSGRVSRFSITCCITVMNDLMEAFMSKWPFGRAIVECRNSTTMRETTRTLFECQQWRWWKTKYKEGYYYYILLCLMHLISHNSYKTLKCEWRVLVVHDTSLRSTKSEQHSTIVKYAVVPSFIARVPRNKAHLVSKVRRRGAFQWVGADNPYRESKLIKFIAKCRDERGRERFAHVVSCGDVLVSQPSLKPSSLFH